jgi:hypothetical protein
MRAERQIYAGTLGQFSYLTRKRSMVNGRATCLRKHQLVFLPGRAGRLPRGVLAASLLLEYGFDDGGHRQGGGLR